MRRPGNEVTALWRSGVVVFPLHRAEAARGGLGVCPASRLLFGSEKTRAQPLSAILVFHPADRLEAAGPGCLDQCAEHAASPLACGADAAPATIVNQDFPARRTAASPGCPRACTGR